MFAKVYKSNFAKDKNITFKNMRLQSWKLKLNWMDYIQQWIGHN